MKKYVYKKRRQPFFKLIGIILRPFVKKPKRIINYNDKIEDKSIIISTHCGKNGPYCLSQYLPFKHATWGAYEMLGKYRERRRYLRDVLYIKKLHKKKFPSSVKATFEAFFNIYIYKGMSVIPTYTDLRFKNTLQYSFECLDNDLPILIFPEDSSNGYLEYLDTLLPGFIHLSDKFYKKEKIDLPVYPMYYDYRGKTIIIGKPIYIQKLKQDKKIDNDSLCILFRDEINKLHMDYIKKETKKY